MVVMVGFGYVGGIREGEGSDAERLGAWTLKSARDR